MGWGLDWLYPAIVFGARGSEEGVYSCVCACEPVRVCPVSSVSVSLQHAAETYERARVGGFCSSKNRMPQDRIG
jgi:hypothetical protein